MTEKLGIMQRSIKKRQRGENWLQKDKIILKELVRERLRILENKNTDTNSNAMKVAAWNDLRESFNRMCNGAPRTVMQLKAQWGILKMWAKKSNAGARKEPLETDAGLLPPLIIQGVCSEDLSSGQSNEFDTNEIDSDSIYQMIVGPPQNTPLSPETIKEVSYTPAEEIPEIQYRKELHAIQMENERQRNKNLKLKEILIRETIQYYKRKNNNKLYDI